MDRAAISRRIVNRLSVALPFVLAGGAGRAMTPPKPMSEAERRRLVEIYTAARKQAAVEGDSSRMGAILARRDQEVGQLLKSSGGSFMMWPATGRTVRLNGRGDRLGIAVELAEGIGLQTDLDDDFERKRTVIARSNPIFEPARDSRDRLVRVSGQLMLSLAGVPVDVMAGTADAGRRASLLALFFEVQKAS